MNLPSPASRADNCYPRYFRIAGRWVNSYKVFLCVGIYLGILVSATARQLLGGAAALTAGAALFLVAVRPWRTAA